MKILQVTSLPRGGPVSHALVLTRSLVELGATVEAVCVDASTAARFEERGARPHVLPLEGPADLRGGERLRRLAARFDVVHAQDRRSGLWSRIWPRRRAQARVYTLHGLPDPFLPEPIGSKRLRVRDRLAYQGLDAYLARRSDAVIAPSAFIAREVVERMAYPQSRIVVIPNGVDPPPPDPSGSLVGTISTLYPVKGLDTFLRAAAELHEQEPAVRFAIFGDGPERKRLEALRTSLGLEEAVEFRGETPFEQALAQLRVYVLPSLLENCPMSLLEAMAAAKPAVATRVGGVPEVAEGVVALAPPADPRALGQEILGLLRNPAQAAELGERGRARVLERFTAHDNARRVLDLYEKAAT
jgi:glycosyltransferase involved in cell wall biosynthesis